MGLKAVYKLGKTTTKTNVIKLEGMGIRPYVYRSATTNPKSTTTIKKRVAGVVIDYFKTRPSLVVPTRVIAQT